VSNYHATCRILAGKRVFSVVSLEEDKREQLTGAFGRGSGKGQTLQSPAQRRGAEVGVAELELFLNPDSV
jgi:hypothetical protein